MAKIHTMPGVGPALQAPAVRTIGVEDLREALRRGLDDFLAMPTHALFIALIYPVLGLFLAAAIFGNNVLPLLYPLVAGFALVGPVAAVGLYELSRRRERGEDLALARASGVLRSPAIGSIAALGGILVAILFLWLATAQALYHTIFGDYLPATLTGFLQEVLTTRRGWTLILIGNAIGLAFGALVLSISVVSFPLLLDRNVGVPVAIQTSLQAVGASPGPMALWGLIVAVLLLVGFIPFFFGLAVVIPVLGHATWHLYRRAVPG
ncbi:DUF2189 domain-containing protein [Microvirga thermotolerans]|uniref:DUF2189 domain-containing protein n=1 Tax=Microvirga thermotolerans TaxID=2651334 RepID=A0A5P9JZT6_9HYPH|nr:DUF2189 domain-containing protein [Microvirga thermotolerans]QFU17963.1 DUF2189 domain-containing protein [Microvirga thermotolerans]